jgi:hypothetical protein
LDKARFADLLCWGPWASEVTALSFNRYHVWNIYSMYDTQKSVLVYPKGDAIETEFIQGLSQIMKTLNVKPMNAKTCNTILLFQC